MELPRSRLVLLSALGAGLGLLSGAAAFLLLRVIGLLTNLLFFRRVEWTIPSFANLQPSIWIPIIAVTGGVLVSLLALWCPLIRGHGIPEAMDAVLTNHSRIHPKAAIAKPVSSAIAIGTGGPFGAEGPIIVTGGALGSLIGQTFRMSPAERKILLACGAAGGMSALFGTPIAAVILAIELLLFEFSPRVFIPLVVAASVAGGVHAALFGLAPLLKAPATGDLGLASLPWFVVLGASCGLLAVVITKGLQFFETGFERLPVHRFWLPIIGALGFGLIGLWQPRALGVGYDAINDIVLGRLAVGAVGALAVAKLLAWWVALGSGTSGGTLAPLLLIGGAFGSLFATASAHLIPGYVVPPGAVALVAMAAVFAAAARAPFAAMVFIFELTKDFSIVLPMMLATVVASFVFDACLRESIMTHKLAKRGLHVRSELRPDPMRTHRVQEVMTTAVSTIDDGATLAEARRIFATTRHSAYPIVDSACSLKGIVTRGDLLAAGEAGNAEGSPIRDIASTDVMVVHADDPLERAVDVMLEEGVEHLPVVAGHRLVGICTRTDLLRAHEPRREHERAQTGWLSRQR